VSDHRHGGVPTVAVVGGGIAGLAAAWELTGGAVGPAPDAPTVVLLEASDRFGGKIAAQDVGTGSVDVGPDGFLARRHEAVALCRELGLGGELEPVAASRASVYARGRLRPLPDALALGVPTRFWPVARSGILGPAGSLRLARDLVAPRRDVRGPLGDRAVGPLVAHKLGKRVVGSLVDPLVGGILAGGVADMSAAAIYPLLLAVAQRRTGFMRALRQAIATAEPGDAGTDVGPVFFSLTGGLTSLVERLVAALAARGVALRTESPVELMDRQPPAAASPWALHTADGPVVADGVVVAVPAGPAATLLGPHDANAATLLRGIDHSSVVVVTLEFPPDALAENAYGTGFLVPRTAVFENGEPFVVTAVTYLSTKWPHLERPGSVLVRASAGRFADDRAMSMDDGELVARVLGELALLCGISAAPTASAVHRWADAFPQYRVHHLLRVTGIESAVAELPAAAVAGATYRGVGIPACVASGRAAAARVLEQLGRPDAPDARRSAGPGRDAGGIEGDGG
jgi:protoporphyrinogen/coproporphyrinogen III oxidase